jgi:hypothetical protein
MYKSQTDLRAPDDCPCETLLLIEVVFQEIKYRQKLK